MSIRVRFHAPNYKITPMDLVAIYSTSERLGTQLTRWPLSCYSGEEATLTDESWVNLDKLKLSVFFTKLEN